MLMKKKYKTEQREALLKKEHRTKKHAVAVQKDREQELELKEFNGSTKIQNLIRRGHI